MKVKASIKIEKFDQQGEKTGWTYLPITAELANKLQPGMKKSFRVKGKLDSVPIKARALLPMGEGNFILTLKADLRKLLRKQQGDTVQISLEADTDEFLLDPDLMLCLNDEPLAIQQFNTLTPGHQRYFSKWVTDAKTTQTRTHRIAQCVDAMLKNWDYGQMIRAGKKQPFDR